eukprot:764033-Hanusia_phi.AAC.1
MSFGNTDGPGYVSAMVGSTPSKALLKNSEFTFGKVESPPSKLEVAKAQTEDTHMNDLVDTFSDLALTSTNEELRPVLNDIIDIHTKLKQDLHQSIGFGNSFKAYIEAGIAEKEKHLLLIESLMTKVGELLPQAVAATNHKKSKLTTAKDSDNEELNLEFMLFRKNVVQKGYMTNWFQGNQSNSERVFFLKCLYRRLREGFHGNFNRDMLLEVIQYKPLFYTVANSFIKGNESVMNTLKSFQSKKAMGDIATCFKAEEENDRTPAKKDDEEDSGDKTWTPPASLRMLTRSAEKEDSSRTPLKPTVEE